jgi:hypothetical protein
MGNTESRTEKKNMVKERWKERNRSQDGNRMKELKLRRTGKKREKMGHAEAGRTHLRNMC